MNAGTDSTSTEAPKRRGLVAALSIFAERRTAVMLGLGFAAGLPNLLIFDTLSAWLRDSGLSLEVISFFSLATIAYSFKFIWAPLVDRTTVPGLTRWLGHRRSWMLVAQAAIVVGLLCIAGSNPKTNLAFVALFAVLTGFSSATQDIVIDAWRIEAADVNRQGALAAAYQWGYRIAIIVAGAVPLILADSYGWNLSYGMMAGLMAIGVASVLLAPREKAHAIRPIPVTGLKAAPLAEALEWMARLALIALGRAPARLRFECQCGCIGRHLQLGRVAQCGSRVDHAVGLKGGRRPAAVGFGACGIRGYRSRGVAASEGPNATRRLSLPRVGRSAGRFLPALRPHGRVSFLR